MLGECSSMFSTIAFAASSPSRRTILLKNFIFSWDAGEATQCMHCHLCKCIRGEPALPRTHSRLQRVPPQLLSALHAGLRCCDALQSSDVVRWLGGICWLHIAESVWELCCKNNVRMMFCNRHLHSKTHQSLRKTVSFLTASSIITLLSFAIKLNISCDLLEQCPI
jgi:hypothetical protein